MKELSVTSLRTGNYLGKVSVAEDSKARLKGLLGTKELAPFHGLLIQPCKQVHTFGMHYPISVWFIDRELKVIRIVDNLQTWRISPYCRHSHSIIEFPQKWAEKTETKLGEYLLLSDIKR